MGQYQVLDVFNYEGFFSSNFDHAFLSSGDNLREFPAECGHCIFLETSTYRELGGENEHFVSYGPEDKERMLRSGALAILLEAYQNMDNAFIPELPLELALIKILKEDK